MRRLVALIAGAALLGSGLTPAQAFAQPSADAAREIPDYRLGAGDKIRVITFGEAALTGEFIVSGSGKAALPLVGEIEAVGLNDGQINDVFAACDDAAEVSAQFAKLGWPH